MVQLGHTSANVSTAGLQQILADSTSRWYKGHLLKLNLWLVLLLISAANNGYDGSMMNGLQAVQNWQNYFHHPEGSILGLFNAIQSVGCVAGLPLTPIVNDKFGRRWTIFTGSMISVLAVALQTSAQNIAMFITARFLIGVGLAFQSVASPILLTELAFPTHRAKLTSLYNSQWYLGSIIAAWSTFGTFRINSTWSWRIPSALQGLPSILQVTLIFLLPESPRWLIANGRSDAAAKVLCDWHCNGDEHDPLIAYEMDEITQAIQMEQAAARSSTYLEFFRTRGNLKRMRIIIALGFFSQWSGNGIVSYYLSIALRGIGITSQADQNLINGILQAWNLVTAYTGALLIDKAGRRRLWLISVGGMLAVYTMWTACAGVYAHTGNAAAGHGVLAAIFLYYLAYNLAMSPLLVAYTVEILPFRLRSKGMMIMFTCVYLAGFFNQYINPIALEGLAWKLYIVYTAWLALEFVYLYLFIVETKGTNGALSLEEIARLFDGEQAAQDLADAGSAVPVLNDIPEEKSSGQMEEKL